MGWRGRETGRSAMGSSPIGSTMVNEQDDWTIDEIIQISHSSPAYEAWYNDDAQDLWHVTDEEDLEMSEYKFFYGGPFSQWFICEFEIDSVTYNCAEQYMMAEKARLFGDKESEAAIMRTGHPREQKALGRRVKGFEREAWDAVSRDTVYRANHAKFTQAHDLENVIRNTGEAILVEASPTDKIWGIGIAEGNPLCNDPANWRGTNWLGEVLTKVRDDILEGITSTEFDWST